ncbi:MAG: hypothetical protein KDB31_00630 [Microthrixaceae bacterium]|nr:hypothetical protein [Microthrixaceae bacterium]
MRSESGSAELGEDRVLELLESAREAAAGSFASVAERHRDPAAAGSLRDRGERPGQYAFDLQVDREVLRVLAGAPVGVLSEESGLDGADAEVVVVVDPIDGSTNASRGVPWFACSLCAVDRHGPWVALVANLATGTTYRAVRGCGATRDGQPIRTSDVSELSAAVVVLNGYPPEHLGWRQYRALGATALDICAVADGSVDATIDCTESSLGPWDYMGAMLVLTEAGGSIADVADRDLVVLDPGERRTPVSAGSEALFSEALRARGSF